GVLLHPLPYPRSDELVALVTLAPGSGFDRLGLTEAEYVHLQEEGQVLEELGVYAFGQATLSGIDDPQRIGVAIASGSLFDALAMQPLLGRSFREEDEQPGARVAILSHGLWERQFGSATDIIGGAVELNGVRLTVVGVMPPAFRLPVRLNSAATAELWVPVVLQPENLNWGSHYLQTVARMKPRAQVAEVQAEVDTLVSRLAQERPDAYAQKNFSVHVAPLHSDLVSDVQPALLLLMAAVGVVLLIACGNVANLLLARATAREKELCIRAALGGKRWHLVRQLLAESFLLALLGGMAGLLLAWWSFDLIVALSPSSIARATESGIDAQVLGFALALSVLTAFVFGLGPALQVSNPDVSRTLREEGRGLSASATRRRIRNVLVVAEVAVAVVLVIGAALLLRSFAGLLQLSPGFEQNGLLTARVSLPASKYGDDQQVTTFYRELVEQARHLPGVLSAAAVNVLPLRGFGGDTIFDIEGRPTAQEDPAAYGGISPHLGYRPGTPGYFKTMGMQVLQGRVFNDFDHADAPLVAVINRTLARRFFPEDNPLGQRLRLYWSVDQKGPWVEIVGIVADSRINSLDEELKQEIFVPAAQVQQIGGWIARTMTVVVRTQGDPLRLVPALRAAVRRLDSSLPVYNIETMEQVVAGTLTEPRFNMVLLNLFAAMALLLAAVGIYGMISYTVEQRTREFGIRMAMGAQPRHIFRLVVGRGMVLTVVGLGVGLAAAFALTRFLATLLFGVGATDPLTFAGVAVVLSAVALLACYLPARRATRVDPMTALRYE
ncbi:MAG: ABC transporter permease, partial [Terriglobia bacterium]